LASPFEGDQEMKSFSKIALLVVFVLLFSLTACTLRASTPAPVNVTSTPPFPFTTPGGDVASFGTQTAIAQTPVGTTPQVQVATETTSPGEQGGGQEAPQAQEQPTQAPQADSGAGAAAAVNTPVVTRPSTYALQKGEWPICIARRYDLDLGSFFANNNMNMNSKPAAGTTLRIPSSGNWSANYGARSLKQHPASYNVVAGDTIYTIACKYGDVTPEAILAVNNLANASDVKAGITLQIP
jgi:LysM repeat protein